MTDTMTSAPNDETTEPTPDAEAPEETASETPSEPGVKGGVEIPTFPGQPLKHSGKEAEIEKIANDYVIPMSENAIAEWAKGSNPEAFKAYAEQVAIGMYPTFAPQIQAGIPVRILLDPYIQVAQQVLGSVPEEPNWTDPKWSAALQGGVDPKTNRPIPMPLDQWRAFLMQHPAHGWQNSPQAHNRAGQFSDMLNRAFTSPQEPQGAE